MKSYYEKILKQIDDNKLYSTNEVAEIMGVKRYSVYNWVKRGQILALKIGGSLRIEGRELKRLVKLKGGRKEIKR